MKKMIYALGYFDGVHLGHRALLNSCRELAQKTGCGCGAITFSVHPQQLLQERQVQLINTNADRNQLLSGTVDSVLELAFNDRLMQMPWQAFCRMLVEEHQAAGFVCGSDFRFGKGGEGSADLLQDYCQKAGLLCQVVGQQYLDGIRISSTHIRKLLEQGDIQAANRFLGHPHILSGIVQSGKQLGRTIGIPTANISYPRELLKMPYGVYACRVQTSRGIHTGMTNIGVRPTVSGEGVTVETHLLDFSGDLYGQDIKILFYAYLRSEQKFPNLSCLQKQVEKDKKSVEKVIQNY